MMDTTKLTPGLEGHSELIVAEEHTAPRIGSGRVHVLATPVMINLMEAAALDAAENLIPAGYQSLGIRLDASVRPPSACACASALATLTGDGRTEFRVEAHDQKS
jgi:predicted thioesterase